MLEIRQSGSAVKLTKLQVLHFRYPLSKPIVTTMGPVSCRPALILRIEDDEGSCGWGEIWCNFPPDGDLYRAQLAVAILPRILAGVSVEPQQTFHHLQHRLQRLALQAGEPGPVAQLCAGVDIAMHDLVARRQGVAIADLLMSAGRKKRPQKVMAYASGISPALFEQQIQMMRNHGFKYFKMRIGFGVEDSIPQLQAASAGLQADETLMADANQAWTPQIAHKRLKQLDALNLGWLEEPLLANSPDSNWQALASVSAIPLAGGENLRSLAEFKHAIKLRALSVYQPDVCKWGGLSGCLEVAREVIESGQQYCPHYLGGGVGLLASAQLLSATGHNGMLEIDSSDNPLQDCLAGGSRALTNGKFKLGDGPGLGCEPDIESARDYLISDTVVTINK
jgi:L-alanine-DL-glutamate epimerase-like enolase superfamily enzyme